MAVSVRSKGFQALLIFSYLSLISSPCCSLYFNLNFHEATSYNDMNCTGDALNINNCKNLTDPGLTMDSEFKGSNGSVGQAYYNKPVPLWDDKTGEVTNFVTTFSFKIDNTSLNNNGDGLAFFISAYPLPLFTGRGGTLGLFNESTLFNESANHIVAVEIDTFKNNDWDEGSSHFGIDINSINSTSFNLIPNDLLFGKKMTARISYNNSTQILAVFSSQDDNQTINFNISTTVDLKSILPKDVVIGFSAATGDLVEYHRIYSWTFNSTLLEITKFPTTNSTVVPETIQKSTLSSSVIGGLIAFSLILLLLVGAFLYLICKKRLAKEKNREIEMVYDDTMDTAFEKGRGPKRFLYKELAAATMEFADNAKLGEGGFGSVYRGILVNERTHVAIKRVSKNSKQGKKEYISEVTIISQLRHRNLVQLIGWCHERGEFLLVYEFMHNGSLDTHLYHKEKVLTWDVRHKIVIGVGFSLLYLHEECEQCVVHRDIKPSNIMLDSNFNAKLGDFGLAKLIDHEAGSHATMPAGTTGYIAPECVLTGITSTDSDIYSFGIVLLEIACGRGPVVLEKEAHEVRLVEWVWSLNGSGSILDAIDPRLNGEFDAQEAQRLIVVGLWCAHPDNSLRPSIRQAISALNCEVPLPNLPPKMPIPVYATPIDYSNFRYSSSIGISSGGISNASTSHTATSSSSCAITSSTSNSSV